jgi:hypothetical protein
MFPSRAHAAWLATYGYSSPRQGSPTLYFEVFALRDTLDISRAPAPERPSTTRDMSRTAGDQPPRRVVPRGKLRAIYTYYT